MELRALEQTRWLLDHGHDAVLAAPPDGEPAARARAAGLPFEPAVFDHPYAPSSVLGLRGLVRRHRIQVIDAHGGRDGKTAAACLGLCAVVRDRHITQPLRSSFTRRLQWRLGCDHVVAVAETIRDRLLEGGLADPTRISVIGEWAEDRFFAPRPSVDQRRALRASLGLAEGAFVVAAVAMLRPDKGHDVLIRAMARMRAGGVDAACLLVGSATTEGADHVEALRRLAAELGLGEHVVFAGYRTDVPEVMAAADALAVPSLVNEGQSRVVPQAFALALPVVASAIGGLPELVRPGETGWLTPPHDSESLARALMELATDRPLAERIAANARRFAEAHLGFDGKMRETLDVYEAARARAARRGATFAG